MLKLQILCYHTTYSRTVKRKKLQRLTSPQFFRDSLFFTEGLAVCALGYGRIGFMRAYQNMVQRTVILMVTVMSTLLDGTFNTLICVTFHMRSSFDLIISV